jgi:DNA-binding NtrC family response regulator
LPAQYLGVIDSRRMDSYESAVTSVNREIILDALARSKGRKAKAAELLKINRRTLYNRMKRLGMG